MMTDEEAEDIFAKRRVEYVLGQIKSFERSRKIRKKHLPLMIFRFLMGMKEGEAKEVMLKYTSDYYIKLFEESNNNNPIETP